MPSPAQSSKVVPFDAFELNLKTGELHKGTVKIRLQEQSFQILASLLEQPGKLVTRESLQERLWPNDTFVDFDKSLNIAVSKLRQALGDSADEPRFIETLPRRGYRFIGVVERFDESGEIIGLPADAGAQRIISPSSLAKPIPASRYLGAAAVFAAVLTMAWFGYLFPRSEEPAGPMRVAPLTTYPGSEFSPDFSPDGEQVVFSWNGESENNFDIYVRRIDADQPRRLTTHPAVDEFPAWSPDGRWIAFLRLERADTGKFDVWLIPAIGGPERKVAEIGAEGEDLPGPGFLRMRLTWLPDSRRLILSDALSSGPRALYAVGIESGEKQQLTEPPAGTFGDIYPLLSEDAGSLAFSRCIARYNCDVNLLGLDADFKPLGPPRQVTSIRYTQAEAWAPDGKSLLVSRAPLLSRDLWRLPVASPGVLHRLDIAAPESIQPAVSAAKNRMAYVGNSLDWDLEALRKNGSGNDAWRFGSFRSSTRLEGAPHFSPDGKRLAFESNRSGLFGIWVSEVDGTGAQLLWDGYGGMPRWSPDSQRIAFDSLVDGDFNIYISSNSGGPPLRLTDHPSTDLVPNWSADGSSVYFASDRSGKFEIWKVSAAGGEPQQMTREGGSLPVESPDGRFVYYLEAQGAPFRGHRPVWRMPVGGGEPSKILERVWARNYAVTRGGIYFIEQPGGLGPGAAFAFRFLDSKSGMIRTLITLPPNVIPGHSFAVSPDEQTILYTRVKMTGSDLMLIENFR